MGWSLTGPGRISEAGLCAAPSNLNLPSLALAREEKEASLDFRDCHNQTENPSGVGAVLDQGEEQPLTCFLW
jgi:hypothetical protein